MERKREASGKTLGVYSRGKLLLAGSVLLEKQPMFSSLTNWEFYQVCECQVWTGTNDTYGTLTWMETATICSDSLGSTHLPADCNVCIFLCHNIALISNGFASQLSVHVSYQTVFASISDATEIYFSVAV